MQKINARQLAVLGMLLAIHIIAGRFFAITLPVVKIGFVFLPVALCAILYGPAWAAILASLGDILGTFLLPYGYFPPITISALLTGLLYGLFLYRKPATTTRITCCVLVINLFVSLILQTYWLSLLSGKGYLAIFPTRVLQNLIMTPIQIICIRLVAYRVDSLKKKVLA